MKKEDIGFGMLWIPILGLISYITYYAGWKGALISLGIAGYYYLAIHLLGG